MLTILVQQLAPPFLPIRLWKPITVSGSVPRTLVLQRKSSGFSMAHRSDYRGLALSCNGPSDFGVG